MNRAIGFIPDPHVLPPALTFAAQVSQHLANVFVEQARYSKHKPESHEEELAMEIYSTPVVFSARFEVRAGLASGRVSAQLR
jgi:hypothetical protein